MVPNFRLWTFHSVESKRNSFSKSGIRKAQFLPERLHLAVHITAKPVFSLQSSTNIVNVRGQVGERRQFP
jgi:hypothetical protein